MPYNWEAKAKRVAKLGKGVMPGSTQDAIVAVPESLPDDPMRLTRAALVELAEARGLEVSDEMTKREIVAALNG